MRSHGAAAAVAWTRDRLCGRSSPRVTFLLRSGSTLTFWSWSPSPVSLLSSPCLSLLSLALPFVNESRFVLYCVPRGHSSLSAINSLIDVIS